MISVPRQGISNIQDALNDLFYHLIIRGVDHEHGSGRAPLPRLLQVWKDLEEVGSDKLLMTNLQDKIRTASSANYDGGLIVDEFAAVDSSDNTFLQVADIFASSVNRILNRQPNSRRTQKDEIADHLMALLGMDPRVPVNETINDMGVHISL